MIAAAAVVPGALVVLPEYRSLADPGAGLRAAARAAIDDVTGADIDGLVVVAAAESARHGLAPAALRVARTYLDGLDLDGLDPAEVVVGADARPDECAALGGVLADAAGRTGLVVVADGSARRGLRAPGHLDDRAFAYDDAWRGAVSRGDAAALAGLDAELAADLLAQGRAPLQVLAAATSLDHETAPRVVVHLEDDPFGVAYLAASWVW